MEDLEHRPRRVAVQAGRVEHLPVFVRQPSAVLHDEQCGGLGEVGVEQFIQLVARTPGRQRRCQPARTDGHGQQPRQQPGLQRGIRRLHARGTR